MTAAHLPIQRPRQAKLLVIDNKSSSATGPDPGWLIYSAAVIW